MGRVSDLPFSQACENNKDAILAVLEPVLAESVTVLEIGAGTGQHATHFAAAMPGLKWLPTELAENIPILLPRCQACKADNLLTPAVLDVNERPWPLAPLPDALFTANTLHIMPWQAVESLFSGLAERADRPLRLAVYGPFNYRGQYTSASNASFDQWLVQRNPNSAIRDFEQVNDLAEAAGYHLLADNAMPANNRLLVWSCITGP